jgi:hypothetical protein
LDTGGPFVLEFILDSPAHSRHLHANAKHPLIFGSREACYGRSVVGAPAGTLVLFPSPHLIVIERQARLVCLDIDFVRQGWGEGLGRSGFSRGTAEGLSIINDLHHRCEKRTKCAGAPEGIRTPGLRFSKPMLCRLPETRSVEESLSVGQSTELRAHWYKTLNKRHTSNVEFSRQVFWWRRY